MLVLPPNSGKLFPRVRTGIRIALLLVLYTPLRGIADDNPPQSEAARRGHAQFSQSCAFCHGANGAGTTEGPNLLRSGVVRHDQNGNLIAPVVRDGRPGKGMPAVHITDSQIADVVAFLHWRLDDADRATPADAHDSSLQHLLTGNADAGKAFFNGAGRCSHCHSPSGDLAGIATKYAPADLQARFLYPADVPKTASITTPSGAQVTGQLLYQDEFSIAVKDREGWYHSWASSEVKFQIQDPLVAHLELLHEYTPASVHDVFAYLETLK